MDNAPSRPPSVDRLLQDAALAGLVAAHGRAPVLAATRRTLERLRGALAEGASPDLAPPVLARLIGADVQALLARSLRPVFNLTGTVLHTNLGRAPLAEEAVAAVAAVTRGASNLEYDLAAGHRGERDGHVAARLTRLTGAQAALVVNNNAAAVLLLLNTLANRREVPVSRGELIEIGGAFRLPAIMARAGCRLVEVGTTNRTHIGDFAEVIGERTGLILKCHRSNFAIEGFTAEVAEADLAALAHGHDLPLAVDLGSGTLVDLTRWGLPREPTVGQTLAAGADLVTFSGDKLLGGPQAGLIVGRADLIARLARNPMKRALRADKMTLAALEATLALYEDPDSLPRRLPALALLTRPRGEIRAQAEGLLPAVAAALGETCTVAITDLLSQIGSGAQPVAVLPSAGLALRPAQARGGDALLRDLAARLRALPRPVIGRLHDGALLLDLRCLDDEAAFRESLARLGAP
ncbi:MAG: L-seryl-tRNA(Sec) selenium transferase [Proteobacteria bacterium]|nr:L-seryl-tRNA(Sec) selenium transferase [Pseudomonadota bacterium]